MYHTEGIVTRISSQVTNGNTTYYMIIGDDNTKLYVASSSLSDELAIRREGDNVKVFYIDDSNRTVSISDFDNLDFSQVKSEDQVRKDDQICLWDNKNVVFFQHKNVGKPTFFLLS